MIINLLVVCARRESLYVFLRDLYAYHIFFIYFFTQHAAHNCRAMAGRTQYDDAVLSVLPLHVARSKNNIDAQRRLFIVLRHQIDMGYDESQEVYVTIGKMRAKS